MVYIYVDGNDKSIRYKCKVTKIGIHDLEIDDRKYDRGLSTDNINHFEIMKIKEFPVGLISLEELRKHGLKANI